MQYIKSWGKDKIAFDVDMTRNCGNKYVWKGQRGYRDDEQET